MCCCVLIPVPRRPRGSSCVRSTLESPPTPHDGCTCTLYHSYRKPQTHTRVTPETRDAAFVRSRRRCNSRLGKRYKVEIEEPQKVRYTVKATRLRKPNPSDTSVCNLRESGGQLTVADHISRPCRAVNSHLNGKGLLSFSEL